MPRPDPAVTEFENRLRAALDRLADELARLPPPPRPCTDDTPGRDLDRHVAVRRLMALVQASRKR